MDFASLEEHLGRERCSQISQLNKRTRGEHRTHNYTK